MNFNAADIIIGLIVIIVLGTAFWLSATKKKSCCSGCSQNCSKSEKEKKSKNNKCSSKK